VRKLFYSVAALALLSGCSTSSQYSSSHLNTKISTSKLAEIAQMSGDSSAAESIYATAAQENASDAEAQLNYANVLVQQNRISEARRILSSRIASVRNPQMLHGPLGSLYVLTGDAQLAVTEFDAALSSDSHNVRWLTNKAIALDLLKQHTEAQALYRKALAASPDDPIVISNLGLSLALSGQKEEATKVMAALGGQELMPRIRNNYDVVRAANGDTTGGNEQTFRLAKAMATSG
jgi:Flp pilus assembly protein TadD